MKSLPLLSPPPPPPPPRRELQHLQTCLPKTPRDGSDCVVQGKEEGASISVGGEKVKLGIPGGDSLREMAAELTIPMKRIGTPQEAAGAMLLLCLPYASFITGQSLEVTGGAYV